MDNDRKSDLERTVNPGYAQLQLAKALVSAEQSNDPGVRERARDRAAKWTQVFSSIVDGTVEYGSRKPLPDTPVWATPEVVTGGFATGALLADGPLLPHEHELLEDSAADSSPETARKKINLQYLSEDGLAALQETLRSGRYEIVIPEEGALLTVAWLVGNGKSEEARRLLDEIGGYFHRLRFYPAPSVSEALSATDVFLWDVETVAEALRGRKPNDRINAQREAIEVWAPLSDQLVSVILQTIDGPLPMLGKEGQPVGGNPFQHIDADWHEQATNVLTSIDDATARYRRCRKPHKKKSNFAQLRGLLEKFISSELSHREIARARLLLARCVGKRGEPGSGKHMSIRTAQREQAAAPTFFDLTKIVLDRLGPLPAKDGVDSIELIVSPVEPDEASESVPARSEIPGPIVKKVRRCERDTVENLVNAGVIPSADTLAEVLPQVTSGIRAMGIRDPELRRLYASVYRAFRRRRSLLLLNLESQVRIEELPWAAAIDGFRTDDLAAIDTSKQALTDISLLTIASFPQAIVPNKMLQELRALAKGATLDLPLVDELAADIFMGRFSGKFVRAAKSAAALLDGSLYATYYDLDCPAIQRLSEHTEKRGLFRRNQTDAFMELVSARAGVRPSGWDVAVNGMLIEQQQILTTQNLAVLTSELGLRQALAARAGELSRKCFRWICRRLQAKATTNHDNLIAIKNSAYAWRQMIFFLSLATEGELGAFIEWADQELEKQPDPFRVRIAPAVVGLKSAAGNGLPPPRSPGNEGAQFLGWANKRHWLMPEPGSGNG